VAFVVALFHVDQRMRVELDSLIGRPSCKMLLELQVRAAPRPSLHGHQPRRS
jgi:hypothetical protein